MYSSKYHLDATRCPSPIKSKTLPIDMLSSSSQQKAITPSIMTAAGAGLSSLFSSLSNTLQPQDVSQSNATTPYSTSVSANTLVTTEAYSTNYSYTYSSYTPITSSFIFSSACTPATSSCVPSTSLFSSTYAPANSNSIFSSEFPITSSNFIFTSPYTPVTSSIFSTAYTSVTSSSYHENKDFISISSPSSNYITETSNENQNLYPSTSNHFAAVTTFDSSKLAFFNSSYDNTCVNKASTSLPDYKTSVASAPSSSIFGALSSLFDVGVSTTKPTSTTETTYTTGSSSLNLKKSNDSYNTISSYNSTLFYEPTSTYNPTSSYNPTSTYETPTVFEETSSFNPTPMIDSTPIHNPTLSYNQISSLGHSPIPEEDLENDVLLEESKYKVSDETMDETNYYSLTSSSFVTSNNVNSTSYINTSISDSYYERPSIFETSLDEKLEEEYREDFEEGVEPIINSEQDYKYTPLISSSSAVTTTSASNDYFYENSNYPMTTKLSTIPETANDTYLSNTDLQEEIEPFEEQITTPAYDYTENENDYIASGDLKNTNLYQSNYSTQSTYQTTNGSTVTNASQPETKKSRFGLGSFLSDGLNAIGSSVNTIKSTATNLAGGAVGVVVAAAQSTQGSSNQNTSQNISCKETIVHNGSFETSMNGQSSLKLTKQVSEMYEEQENYMDSYGAKQQEVVPFKI
jgi:hypothetical protein